MYYAIRTTTTGAQTLVLPPNLGPNAGAASNRSICSGDTVATYVAGFDNAVTDAAYSLSKAQMPAISGANGQADVTTSASGTSTYP